MNLKIDSGSLRLRLSAEELKQLIEEGALSEQCRVGSKLSFSYGVRLADVAALCTQTEKDAVIFWAPADEVKALIERPPAKDLGLYALQESPPLKLAVEVDLFSAKRKRA